MTKAVFLDRDDTLIRCLDLPPEAWATRRGDTGDPRWVEALPGAIDACERLVRAGYTLVVITNQGAVARGHITLAQVAAVNARTRQLFVDRAGQPLLRACFACPFHPTAPEGPFHREHPWRKPRGGMIRAAALELGLDLSQSWMVGDASRDVDAGLDAGLPRARCRQVGRAEDGADHDDLAAAATEILHTSPGAVPRPTQSPVRPATPDEAWPEAPPDRGSRLSSSAAAAGAVGVFSVTLRALSGTPLSDPGVRDTVLSTAHAIAERTGVALVSIDAQTDRVTATLATHRLAVIGFGAELRRLTNRWHEHKFGGPLWGEPSGEW